MSVTLLGVDKAPQFFIQWVETRDLGHRVGMAIWLMQ